ncbi:Protein Smaug -like protein 1 [Takifugu flavidus]|uniref:Protein Smaug homolog 1 n=1 Tax=Takifugu flavidus TaxID=433684 RepID=A0A5C6NKF6_9TELE|nr:Protein Smaug -like protein 1 [Takifugu flavidus]
MESNGLKWGFFLFSCFCPGLSGVISQWQGESKERVISLVLTHLPLLKPGNVEAKSEYMRLLPRILAHTIEHGRHLEESRQLLSYALIHPATSLEDRSALALWLNHLEERAAARGDSLERPLPAGPHHHQSTPPSTLTSPGSSLSSTSISSCHPYSLHHHQRYGSDDRLNGWQSSRDSGLGVGWHQQQQGCENGHLLLYPSSSVPTTINTVGTGGGTSTILTSGGGSQQHSPLKRSVSLTPPMSGPSSQPLGHVWLSQEDLRTTRGPALDHAPLSPQSSIASSGSGGSEHLEEAGLGGGCSLHRSSFHEEGSGMRDVPTWLKSLRLHKYASLFSTMTYDEMMSLTEEQLEAQKVTKGARHKIVISILKLKERQHLLRSLEKDVLEGGNLRAPLQELHQMIMTPIKAFSGSEETSPQRPLLSPEGKSAAPGSHLSSSGGIEAESGTSVIAEGDLTGQFTRVMGKVCTQLLVSRSDEENISSYLQLIDKCLNHESFTDTQKKRLLSWKQQVQRLFRSIPRKALLDLAGYRTQRSRFGQSNSLPTTACVGSSVSARRSLRQFQMPSRSLPGARLGLLGSGGLLGPTPRSSSSTPTGLKQGRQGLWFANPGGSNSIPSRTHSSVQRTRSLPVHTTPQTMVMFQQSDLQLPVTEPDINNRLESLCLSMTEHALGVLREDPGGVVRTVTVKPCTFNPSLGASLAGNLSQHAPGERRRWCRSHINNMKGQQLEDGRLPGHIHTPPPRGHRPSCPLPVANGRAQPKDGSGSKKHKKSRSADGQQNATPLAQPSRLGNTLPALPAHGRLRLGEERKASNRSWTTCERRHLWEARASTAGGSRRPVGLGPMRLRLLSLSGTLDHRPTPVPQTQHDQQSWEDAGGSLGLL